MSKEDKLKDEDLVLAVQSIVFDEAVQYANNGSRNFYEAAAQILSLVKTRLLGHKEEYHPPTGWQDRLIEAVPVATIEDLLK